MKKRKRNKKILFLSVLIISFILNNGFNGFSRADEGIQQWYFDTQWQTLEHFNYSTGAATSNSYTDSTFGYIFGERNIDETDYGHAEGSITYSEEWDCPVDNEIGEIVITCEYGAFAYLGVNSSGFSGAKLWLTFFIDDIQHEVIIYNNTITDLETSDNLSIDSVVNWSHALTLNQRTYVIGVTFNFEIEFTGDAESAAGFIIHMPDEVPEEGDGTVEYWAVIIGVEYKWCFNVFQIPFYKNALQMCDVIDVSDHWTLDEDHIRVLINENASLIKIIDALRWLDHKDDGDDISLVYYTGHGGNFSKAGLSKDKIDLPPRDEDDGYDEFLTTYWTAKNPFAILTDDMLNIFLGELDSEGIAVVIDSCFSGGMIDEEDAANWIIEFSGELDQSGRVMMTCCEEHEEGTSDLDFANYFMQGLQGYADKIDEGGNNDGVVSAEEAFEYSNVRYSDEDQHPVIYDRYDGELILSDVEFPPNPANWIDGPYVGELNTEYTYSISSTDPEGHAIKYGWDWNEEYNEAKYSEVDEWTSEDYPSGETCVMSHLWNEPGIYDIRVKSRDEYGAEGIFPTNSWSEDWTTIITSEYEIVDQYQIEDRYERAFPTSISVTNTEWRAQSFTPLFDIISKIKLELIVCFHEPVLFDFFIRESLNGENLVEISKEVIRQGSSDMWVEFDFPDLTVDPGTLYYMIIKCNLDQKHVGWRSNQDDNSVDPPNSYIGGEGWVSEDAGVTWECPFPNLDYCFVDYKLTIDNNPPNAPNINGETNGESGEIYEYNLLGIDPDGNEVYFIINWGDDTDNEEVGPYSSGIEVTATHSWSEEGDYTILVKTKDIYGAESDWTTLEVSMPVYILIPNNPPNRPHRPNGSVNVDAGISHFYYSKTIDPDNDFMLYYQWDWGDEYSNWYIVPWPEGLLTSRSHAWDTSGNYDVRIRAKDIHGAISDWSLPLSITVENDDNDGTCFLAGTKITMVDGSYRNIEDVRIDDIVLSFDVTNGMKRPARVTDVYHHKPKEMTDYYLIINGDLHVTPNHFIFVDGRWIEAGNIQLGDLLLNVNQKASSPISVRSVERIYNSVDTYNLEVEGCGVYMAQNIAVHSQKVAIDLLEANL